MRAAEMLIWLGDFNYRVDCSYKEAKEYIQQGWIKELLAKVPPPPTTMSARSHLDCSTSKSTLLAWAGGAF